MTNRVSLHLRQSLWAVAMATAGLGAPQAQEPAVNTSAPEASGPAPAPAVAPVSTPTPARPAARAPTAAAPATTRGANSKAADRLQLDTMRISGNSELPQVSFLQPWRKPDPGDVNGKPWNSIVDEALAPIDRDVFARQTRYYAELKPGATQRAAAATAPVPANAGPAAPDSPASVTPAPTEAPNPTDLKH